MALNPADIAEVSRLLDLALALPVEEREGWLTALPEEQKRHLDTLRDMLAQEAGLDSASRMGALPRLGTNESVASEGDLVGPYRLIREIGRGGMGSVWLADRADGSFRRQVALKLPRLAWGSGLATRMERERDIGALLEHPNIARLYDAGVDERGRPYLALEYIDGQPIDAWCEAQGLDTRARLRLFLQVAKAVAYAHGRLVVHRDLKPSNVLVGQDGQAHLLDFGIAKLLQDAVAGESSLTQEQGRVLTPHYASPEQVAGETITVQSDVYSLGVLLYETLTGVLPIAPKRESAGALEDAILEGNAAVASSRVSDRSTAKALRGEVDAILAKSMHREPTKRYSTADALAQDVERHLSGETVAAKPDSAIYRLRKSVRRHWVGVSASAAVIIATLVGAGVAAVQAQRATKSAERERVVKAFVTDVFRVSSQIDPRDAALRPTSTQQLLEGGARLIQQRFAGQPELQAELYGVVGSVFSDMGAYRLAVDYGARQVESLTALRAEPTDQIRALLALTSALSKDYRFEDAELRAKKALELANDDKPLAAEAQMLMAEISYERGRFDETRAMLRRLEKEQNMAESADSILKARALALQGALLFEQNGSDEAVPICQKAIDMAQALEGRLSRTVIDMRLSLAKISLQAANVDLARTQAKSAVDALRELGGAHEARAAMESAAFAQDLWLDHRYGTATEAIDAIAKSRDTLAKLQIPIPDWMHRRLEFMLGNTLIWYGNIQDGAPLIVRHAEPLLAIAPTPKIELDIASSVASGLMYLGRHDEANHMYRRILEIIRRMGTTTNPYHLVFFGNASINLEWAGRYREAMAVLDEAPAVKPPINGGSFNAALWNRLLQWQKARVLTDQGEYAAALKLLRANMPTDGEAKRYVARFNKNLGLALCLAGSANDGLKSLKLALDEIDMVHESPSAPWTAHLRAHMGLCAVAAGERNYAKQLADQARSAFSAQPGVPQYFKAPLVKLERLLGMDRPPV